MENFGQSVAAAADDNILTAESPAVRIQYPRGGDVSIHLACLDKRKLFAEGFIHEGKKPCLLPKGYNCCLSQPGRQLGERERDEPSLCVKGHAEPQLGNKLALGGIWQERGARSAVGEPEKKIRTAQSRQV